MSKPTIYNSKGPKKASSTKTIKLGDQEHIVMSPQELMQFKREFDVLKRKVQQLENELSTIRNSVRRINNTPAPKPPSNPWGTQ